MVQGALTSLTTSAAVAKNIDNWIFSGTGLSQPDVASLRDWQLERIRSAVSRVKSKSRFYSAHLEKIPVPESWEDFFSLPFTCPENIAEDPYAFLCVPRTCASRIVTLRTSGTGGRRKRVFFTDGDMLSTVDFFEHGMALFTAPGDRVAIFMPGSQPGSVGGLLAEGLCRMGAEPVIYGVPEDFSEAARFLLENDINGLVGLPWDIYGISRSPVAAKLQQEQTLRFALLSADCVTPAMSRELAGSLGLKVYEHYGMTETCYGGGVFCSESEGYHLREADMFFEIVDPQTGAPVPAGQTGEVAVTTFFSQAMPLIRYRTGDLARFSPVPCPCGSIFPVLERVSCRISDVIFLNGHSPLSLPEIEDAVRTVFQTECFHISWCEQRRELTISIAQNFISETETAQLFAELPLSETGIALRFEPLSGFLRDKTGMLKRTLRKL